MTSPRFPVSFAQQRLWFIDQMQQQPALFNLHTCFRTTMPIDVVVLERALNEIVRRHDTLRTSFHIDENGELSQCVASSLHLTLLVIDLSSMPAPQREAEVSRLASQDARTPFELDRAPLLRVRVLRLGPSDHVLLFTMHHIISDGWSLGVFWKELDVIWRAYAKGETSPLPDLKVQYADYVRRERAELGRAELGHQLDYWKGKLAEAPFFDLRKATLLGTQEMSKGAHLHFDFPLGVLEAMSQIGQRETATLFMVLFAAYIALLYRLYGQADLPIGTYVAGRNQTEFELLIGFFLNTVVLRVDASGDPTFAELVRRVRTVALEAYANQDVPFAKVVEELKPDRDLNRNPFFEVLFQLLNVPTLKDTGRNPNADLIHVERGASAFDLSFTIQQSGDRLSGEFEYRLDLFDESKIRTLVKRYINVLQGIARNPQQRISELPVLSPNERMEIIRTFSQTKTVKTVEDDLVKLFEFQVDRTPDRVALTCSGKSLSFSEVNRNANRLAAYLASAGISAEDLIGICLERSFDSVIAILAVMKTGAGFLPLDPTYPRNRLIFMAGHAKIRAVITRENLQTIFSESQLRVIGLDADSDAIAQCDDRNPESVLPAQRLAYVIYTSGSTGMPKGVAVDVSQVLNRLKWMWEEFPFALNEVACQKTKLGFVDSIWEILGSLLKGITTAIIADEALLDIRFFVETLAEQNVTRLWLVPSLLRELLNSYPDLQAHLPKLNFWVSSGEELPVDLLKSFCRAMPQASIFNLYGTSEIWDATWYDATTQGESTSIVPVGKPITNVQAYILDCDLEPVPAGTEGELYIGGSGLARGYIEDAEQTAKSFLPNPFSAFPGSRLYKTGDLARWTAHGDVELLGRADRLVKIRGHRVELSEIENALQDNDCVSQAVAVVPKNDTSQVYCYVTASGNGVPVEFQLRTYLRNKLPDHMIPARIVVLNKLPLTSSGKVNREALSKSSVPMRVASAHTRLSTVQRTLQEMWSEILGRRSVGLEDNFFDLGGHSLLLIRLLARLRERYNGRLTITDLFQFPTIASQAAFLEQHCNHPKAQTLDLDKIKDRARKQRERLGHVAS